MQVTWLWILADQLHEALCAGISYNSILTFIEFLLLLSKLIKQTFGLI